MGALGAASPSESEALTAGKPPCSRWPGPALPPALCARLLLLTVTKAKDTFSCRPAPQLAGLLQQCSWPTLAALPRASSGHPAGHKDATSQTKLCTAKDCVSRHQPSQEATTRPCWSNTRDEVRSAQRHIGNPEGPFGSDFLLRRHWVRGAEHTGQWGTHMSPL